MYLVIGAGLSGAIIAERIAHVLHKEVLVLERRSHIGGNIYDYKNEYGITVHQYGPHAFHTNDVEVWKYLSKFTEWTPYFHKVEGCIDGIDIPLPFNLNSINMLFPEYYSNQIAKTLIKEYGFNSKVTIHELLKNSRLEQLAHYVYEKVFLGYTQKQWGLRPDEVDISVAGRVPIVVSRDNRYFHDVYQAIPKHGYTAMIKNLLDSPKIHVEFRPFSASEIQNTHFEKLIYTGPIDAYFKYCLGELPYRSLTFDTQTLTQKKYQNTAQKNYPCNFDFTRVTEFKHFLDEQADVTTIAFEYSQAYDGSNERYYPVPNAASEHLYSQYKALAEKENNVFFLGRLAEYKYYNMDQAARSALNLFGSLGRES